MTLDYYKRNKNARLGYRFIAALAACLTLLNSACKHTTCMQTTDVICDKNHAASRPLMQHTLKIGETDTFTVFAGEFFSRDYIKVAAGEVYEISSLPGYKWTDKTLECDAAGTTNPILLNSKKRVRGVKCFTLCGIVDSTSKNSFAIGCGPFEKKITTSGDLHFFPNDHYKRKYCLNNLGFILISVKRQN